MLDMRVAQVDTGVLPEERGAGGEDGVEDGELVAMETEASLAGMGMGGTVSGGTSEAAQQRAMKSLFGEDEREAGEESDVIPTLEPLPPSEVRDHGRIERESQRKYRA